MMENKTLTLKLSDYNRRKESIEAQERIITNMREMHTKRTMEDFGIADHETITISGMVDMVSKIIEDYRNE